MYLNEAADAHPDLTVINVHHEQAAAIACEGYYRASSRMALCMITAGPGVMNCLTGVAAAWLDRIPMFVVSGQLKRDDLGVTERPRWSCELPTTTLAKPITAYASLVTGQSEIKDKTTKALEASKNGPVWLDIPLDVQIAEV